jgi:hypothetical protein
MPVTSRNKAVVITKPKIALVKPGIDVEIKSVSFPSGISNLCLQMGPFFLRQLKHYTGIARLKTSQRLKFNLARGFSHDFKMRRKYIYFDFIGGANQDFE